MSHKKTVYIIGHRNPDTDSIVSAIAYADLKQRMGCDNCVPARAGKLNLQTQYILNRFNMPMPEFISDLTPRVRNYMSYQPYSVPHSAPLWNALEVLNQKNFRMLPIVDDDNRFISLLHYNMFAENMMQNIDPHKHSIIPTSVSHLTATLNAQPLVVHDTDTVFKSHIVIAAAEFETFKEILDSKPPENTILIVGDREDVHIHAVERKVRVLIITGGSVISSGLKKEAEKNGVSILVSPFVTSTTSWLALYSTPVSSMGDSTLEPVQEESYIRDIRGMFSSSISRTLPVVDDENRVIGIISQGDLMKDPNIEIIMVDHNELTQAVEGIENYRILEIIDHHRLGNLHTTYPITFINRPVGSTSTIIASMYEEHKKPMSAEIASILLAGILSDTLILRSATTTDADLRMADYLSGITDLPIDEFGRDIMEAASAVSTKPAREIISMDMKTYTEGDHSFSVSQVEVSSLRDIMDRKDEILEELERINDSSSALFSCLMVTDITELNSILFIKGDQGFINRIRYPKISRNIFQMKGILSRKKQLIPFIIELMRRNEQ